LTPSEQLTKLAEDRANSPEHMKEVLALVIDRETAAIVSNINFEIGKGARFDAVFGRGPNYIPNNDYERLLGEYVQAKLRLHQLRKSLYYPFSTYAEREGDLRPVLDCCKELRQTIRAMRQDIPAAAWGEAAPEPAPTPHDKPLLYAMDSYECSSDTACPKQGEYWYYGRPYCRQHFAQARFNLKRERRWKQQQARARRAAQLSGDWSVAAEKTHGAEENPKPPEPCSYAGCTRIKPHVHSFGRVEEF